MDGKEIFINGSKWLRSDFHLHTMADSEFAYSGEKKDFVSRYISQLVKEKISVCVITNHNKFDLAEFKSLRKEAKRHDIFMLPGVEFSLKEGSKGTHVLIVFNYDWIDNQENCNYIQNFLDAAFVGIPNYSNAPYPNSNYTLIDLYNRINAFNKDYFFIMAHVDGNNGMFQEIEGRNLEAFLSSEAFKTKVLATQKNRNIGNQSKVPDKAFVEGTDNAKGGIDAIGLGNEVDGVPQKTFIKLGDYNFEALKYALQDYKHRVSNRSMLPKNAYIKSINIEGAMFSDQTINLSPELNTFIGIRGSGKSSLLEIIRYVLGLPLSKSSVDEEYKEKLIEFTLGSGGRVTLHLVDNHAEEYRIEKIYGKKEDIYKESTNEKVTCSVESLINNIIYYGQNDLSNKEKQFQTDFLNKLISPDKELRQKIENEKKKIKEIVYQIQSLETDISQVEEIEQQIQDMNHRLEYFKKNGLEEKLKSQTEFSSDEMKILRFKDTINSFKNSLNEVFKNYENVFSQELRGSEQNKDIFENINKIITQANVVLQTIGNCINDIASIQASYDITISQIRQKGEDLKEEFAKIKRDLNSEEINPDVFLSLSRLLETSTLKLQELKRRRLAKETLVKDLDKSLSILNKLFNEDFNNIKRKAEQINENNMNLKVEVKFEGNRRIFVDKMKSVFKGVGIRDNNYLKLSEKFLDFIELYRRREEWSTYIPDSFISGFKERFDKELSSLLTYEVEHEVIISYKGQIIDNLSLGQRASALILFLLTQRENDILIIDQPEDDLDNQVIYDEVIKKLLELKGQMQFIFATHNPNIPVLGDCEKVLAFKYDDDKKIEIQQGTIDTLSLQESIVQIMEGGKEAFERRNSIYEAWKV